MSNSNKADYSYRADEDMIISVLTNRKISFKKEIKRHVKEIIRLLYIADSENEAEICNLVNWLVRCKEVKKKFRLK